MRSCTIDRQTDSRRNLSWTMKDGCMRLKTEDRVARVMVLEQACGSFVRSRVECKSYTWLVKLDWDMFLS